jgi:Rne/Rng family ribonuclease
VGGDRGQGRQGEAAGAAVPRARARRARHPRGVQRRVPRRGHRRPRLFEEVRDYVAAFNPELADRIEYYDAEAEGLPLFERHHVHEQVHKALDRKVWLPSGGSLIIEHTEALTVIDVNTGKNVGTSNLEATVFHNNIEAAEEIAKQLRLRDIGGIIVIDFIDMEIKGNRAKVVEAFRSRSHATRPARRCSTSPSWAWWR